MYIIIKNMDGKKCLTPKVGNGLMTICYLIQAIQKAAAIFIESGGVTVIFWQNSLIPADMYYLNRSEKSRKAHRVVTKPMVLWIP